MVAPIDACDFGKDHNYLGLCIRININKKQQEKDYK